MTQIRVTTATGIWRGTTRHWDTTKAPEHRFDISADDIAETREKVSEHFTGEGFQAFLKTALAYAPSRGTLIVFFTALDEPFDGWGWALEPYCTELGAAALTSFLNPSVY